MASDIAPDGVYASVAALVTDTSQQLTAFSQKYERLAAALSTMASDTSNRFEVIGNVLQASTTVQDQHDRIQELESRVETLESIVETLERQVENLPEFIRSVIKKEQAFLEPQVYDHAPRCTTVADEFL